MLDLRGAPAGCDRLGALTGPRGCRLALLFAARLLTGSLAGLSLLQRPAWIIAATTPREKMAPGQGSSLRRGAGAPRSASSSPARRATAVKTPGARCSFLCAPPAPVRRAAPGASSRSLRHRHQAPADPGSAAAGSAAPRGSAGLPASPGVMPIYVQALLGHAGPGLLRRGGRAQPRALGLAGESPGPGGPGGAASSPAWWRTGSTSVGCTGRSISRRR